MPTITVQPDQLKNLDLSKEVSLVADQGIYLINIGHPKTVAYAKGLNPKVDQFDDWWERKHRIMGGGDDEVIRLGMFPNTINKHKSLKVKINKKSVSLIQ